MFEHFNKLRTANLHKTPSTYSAASKKVTQGDQIPRADQVRPHRGIFLRSLQKFQQSLFCSKFFKQKVRNFLLPLPCELQPCKKLVSSYKSYINPAMLPASNSSFQNHLFSFYHANLTRLWNKRPSETL